jgi:hypothetical protein
MDGKGVKKSYMSVDAIRLVMVRECSKAQLVEDTSLIDTQIVLDFTVAPVRQVLGIVVDLKLLVFDRRCLFLGEGVSILLVN